MKYTINQFRKEYPSEDVCLDAIFAMRYSKIPCCPQCSQQTTFKRVKGRRSYQCSDKDCQYQLYPTSGTVFEKTRTSLVDWFYAIYLMTSTRNGVSAKELERQLGVTYKTAWRMGHQLRKLMAQGTGILSGIVEVDEVFIGGKSQNMHLSKRAKFNMNAKGLNAPNKTPIVALLERNGNIITKVVSEVSSDTLKGLVYKHVGLGSTLFTDSYRSYKGLHGSFQHTMINHVDDEYVKGSAHTNTVEGFFSHLKRTIKGTHIQVSRKYLQQYANEVSFRYVHRNEGQMMFKTILGRVVA